MCHRGQRVASLNADERMKPFDDLVAEAEAADVSGWGFDWLAGRAGEERPSWGYARLLAQRLAGVESALDLDTGGGEVLDEAPRLPPRMCATEAWPPNARKARERLAARGVQVSHNAVWLFLRREGLRFKKNAVRP